MTGEGALPVGMSDEFLMDLILHSLRKVPLELIVATIQKAERAESVGPLLNPSAWTGAAMAMHMANLDVLRRMEDLRRALIELDATREAVTQSIGEKPVEGITLENNVVPLIPSRK